MKSQLEDLTFVEFRERIKDNPVLLIPLGSQEQQVMKSMISGWDITQIAGELDRIDMTVKMDRTTAMRKLEATPVSWTRPRW